MKGLGMTERSQSEDQVLEQKAADVGKGVHIPEWHTKEHATAEKAIEYANSPPRSEPGRIVFHALPNGKVRTYSYY
jgi:hypothetical protein